MLLEHLVYSFAVALIAGMIYYKYTGRDPSWLIILGTIMPDVDYVLYHINYFITGNNFLIIIHGTFHNVTALVILSILVGLFFLKLKMPFFETAIFFGIGMGCHFIEDAITYKHLYTYFAPFSMDKMGWGILHESFDIFQVAGFEVLIPGLALLFISIIIRSICESEWSFIDYTYETIGYFKYSVAILLNINISEDE